MNWLPWSVLKMAEEEAASRALEMTLSAATPHVRKGFETTLKSKRFEVDVLARFGDYLFIFECKHSLLPCNPHEMRTSYDHVEKAANQLTNIKSLLGESEVELELYRRLGWKLPPALKIITCIVSCNGMFPGLVLAGHPIRRWAELRNAIETGIVRGTCPFYRGRRRSYGAEAEHLIERRLWMGDKLTPEFLLKYIEDGLLQSPLFSAMERGDLWYDIGNGNMIFISYALDAVAAERNLRQLLSTDEGQTCEGQLSS